MRCRSGLIAAYIEALPAKAVLILAGPDDNRARLSFNEDSNLDLFDALWFAKPQHAELVLINCCDDFRDLGAGGADGWIDLAPRTVRDFVVNIAAGLGAPWRSVAEVEADATIAVEEIIATVDRKRREGGLALVNTAYKIYRQRQVANGEKAVPYSTHLASFTRSLVTLAAKNATLR